MTGKKLIRYMCMPVLAVGLLLLGEACGGGGAAGGANEVTLFAYSGIFQENYEKAVVEPFMEENPNITVNYQPGEDSAQMLAQLRAQRNRQAYDVAIMDVSVAATGNKEGIFGKPDPNIVTSLEDLSPEARTPNGFGPSVTFDNLSLIYNTDRIKEAPTSWEALWNREYENEVLVTAPPDIQGLAFTVITDEMEGANYKKTIDPAIAQLEELAPLVLTWEPNPDQYTVVTSGDAAIAVGWNARSQLYADQSGGKMAVALPEEGSVFQKNTINLVKGSDSSEAAQKFINYALSPEAQRRFAETMYYAPVNEKVELPEEVLERTAASEDYKSIPVDWNYVAGVQDEWLERWRQEVIAAG